ncbi:MAG TPA: glycosyltransferase family 4 protein [Candidatus Peribacteraceae bacterium]|nr:glycosyltransferase family 4 protein [Candidatus Peribacteraceae bacterium]
MPTLLLISPYWKEPHRWMVSSVKLADLWQRLGYHVTVVCMGEETSVEEVSDTLTIHRRKDFFLRDPWNYGIALGFSGYVRRLAKRLDPDVIVVNKVLFWSSLAVIRLRLAGKHVIVLTDALVGITWWPRGQLPKIASAIYARTVGWLILLTAYRVVFFHPQPDRMLRRLGIKKKSEVIPTGIDFTPQWIADKRSPDTVTVTYVGRLESVKGVDDFLAAVTPLKKHHPSLEVQVVGWYAEHNQLVEQYRHHVRFTGLRDDIPDILTRTDIFVLPSYSEGLSNALLEAMASGCACIATDVGGNAFLIQNGVSGFLFPPGDREALRAHISRLLEDSAKRRMLGAAARRRIEAEFSWEKIGEKYRKLFRKVTVENL